VRVAVEFQRRVTEALRALADTAQQYQAREGTLRAPGEDLRRATPTCGRARAAPRAPRAGRGLAPRARFLAPPRRPRRASLPRASCARRVLHVLGAARDHVVVADDELLVTRRHPSLGHRVRSVASFVAARSRGGTSWLDREANKRLMRCRGTRSGGTNGELSTDDSTCRRGSEPEARPAGSLA
jgi:hypothetical protein